MNKGSALSQLGRRREAIALDEAALRMAQVLPNRNFEMRVRNNLASVLGDDDPVRATQIMLDSAEVAREMGDRGMYYWLTTQARGASGPRREIGMNRWNACAGRSTRPLFVATAFDSGPSSPGSKLRAARTLARSSRSWRTCSATAPIRTSNTSRCRPMALAALVAGDAESRLP